MPIVYMLFKKKNGQCSRLACMCACHYACIHADQTQAVCDGTDMI